MLERSTTSSIKQRLLEQLAGARFCSGQVLAAELNLSRTAVWKHIRSLRESGFIIDAVRGKGYRLVSEFELLDHERIVGAIDTEARQHIDEILLFPALTSTNDYLLQQCLSSPLRQVVIAEQQTAGRGRLGRSWLSSAGSVTLSLSWRFQRSAAAMSGLTLALAVAVIRAIGAAYKLEDAHAGISVKWPNDIVVGDKKLAGILVEMHGETHGPVDIVIGVGINIDFPLAWQQQIDQPVTDLKRACGHAPSRNQFVADLISQMVAACRCFDEQGFTPFKAAWLKRDQSFDKQVTIRMGDQLHQGTGKGVDDNGALLLMQGESVRAFYSGEIEQSCAIL
ncbi:MAG: biotin--[acetyl-CoA-carboxylase] ligase [Thiotrichales bacterium]|nr:biotin--[acetyl-CoA-carboxylase] ligase [Thiotrichales bacterium]